MDLTKFWVFPEKVKPFFEDKVFLWATWATLILVTLQLSILALFWKQIPPQVPLFYSRPWGEEQLAEKRSLFVLPAALLFFSLINLYLSLLSFQNERLLAKIFVFATILLTFLFNVTFFKILFLTTF